MEKIIALGRQKGVLTYDEVNDLLPDDLSSSEQIDKLFELLGNEDIQLIESEEEKAVEKPAPIIKEDLINEQLKAEERFLPLDDPVKMYLKQMGSISLLSRENEIELAKRIEEAEERFKRAALATKFCRNETLAMANEILEGRVNFEEVVKEDIKVKKNNVLNKVRRITRRLRYARSASGIINLMLQLNFVTSVIELSVRRLNKFTRELDHLDSRTKKNRLRK